MSKTYLFNPIEKKYGSAYQSHLFEQYKMYLEGIEKISDRRQSANSFFITINTALITFVGLSTELDKIRTYSWVKPILALTGIVICFIFWFLIRAYKQLNTGKFKVLHEIEEKMPLAMYKYEWDILKRGKDKSVYYPFSHIELLIPWVFGIIYLLVAIQFFF